MAVSPTASLTETVIDSVPSGVGLDHWIKPVELMVMFALLGELVSA